MSFQIFANQTRAVLQDAAIFNESDIGQAVSGDGNDNNSSLNASNKLLQNTELDEVRKNINYNAFKQSAIELNDEIYKYSIHMRKDVNKKLNEMRRERYGTEKNIISDTYMIKYYQNAIYAVQITLIFFLLCVYFYIITNTDILKSQHIFVKALKWHVFISISCIAILIYILALVYFMSKMQRKKKQWSISNEIKNAPKING